jgi:PAS domain S-box-containing protein
MSSLSLSEADSSSSEAVLSQHDSDKKVDLSRKRFQTSVPVLFIDQEGQIVHLTETALRLLEYATNDVVDDYFFSHVHGKNLHQVMRDVAHMVRNGKKEASWMLRLRTGQGRWRWYKAEAENELDSSSNGGAIKVRLRHLYQW